MNDFLSKIIKKNTKEQEDVEEILENAKEKGCPWKLDGMPCSGNMHLVSMYRKMTDVVTCDRHYEMHVKTMMLYKMGSVVDDILNNIDKLDQQFIDKFGTNEISRQTCVKMYETSNLDFCESNYTDDELIELFCMDL